MSLKYFSTVEVAKILGISRIAVFKRIKRGSLPALRAGRSYLIEKHTLVALIQASLSGKRDIAKALRRRALDSIHR